MKHEWEIFKSLRRFLGIIFYCMCINLMDLSNFFLKTILWVPASSDLLKVRLFILCTLGLAGTEEFFEYLTNKYDKRVRPHMWVLLYQVFIEWTVIIKHHKVYITNPFPTPVVVMWSSIAAIIALISIWIYMRERKQKKEEPWNPYDPPLDIKQLN